MTDLYILRGIPGCGKSELAETLADNFSFAGLKVIIASADDYFIGEDGEYRFDASLLGKAHNTCQSVVEMAMDAKFDVVIVDNTNTTQKEMKPYFKMAEMHDYKVISLIVENRHGGESVHDVPEASLQRMEDRFMLQLR